MVQNKKFEQTFFNEYLAFQLHDYDVEQRAMAAGMEKGLEKGKAEDAKAFLKLGVPIETVEKCTGLPMDYLKTLV